MKIRQEGCRGCEASTTGDCGAHGPAEKDIELTRLRLLESSLAGLCNEVSQLLGADSYSREDLLVAAKRLRARDDEWSCVPLLRGEIARLRDERDNYYKQIEEAKLLITSRTEVERAEHKQQIGALGEVSAKVDDVLAENARLRARVAELEEEVRATQCRTSGGGGGVTGNTCLAFGTADGGGRAMKLDPISPRVAGRLEAEAEAQDRIKELERDLVGHEAGMRTLERCLEARVAEVGILQARIAALTRACEITYGIKDTDALSDILRAVTAAKAALTAPDLAPGERWRTMEWLLKVLERCEGNRGWLSCVPPHDCRCELDRKISDKCTCGADEYREALAALDKVAQ